MAAHHQIVRDLYSELAELSKSKDLYYARKILKEQIQSYSDVDLQSIAEILLQDKDSNVEGSRVLFGIVASIRANKEHTKQLEHLSTHGHQHHDETDGHHDSKQKELEGFVYSNYRPFLRYPELPAETAEQTSRKWLKVSGDLTSLKVDPNGKWVEYGDRATRVQAISCNKEEEKHFFSIPKLIEDNTDDADEFIRLNILELSAQDPTLLERTLTDVSNKDKEVILQDLCSFDYANLERRSSCGYRAIPLPDTLSIYEAHNGSCRGFNTNEDGSHQIDVSVLQLPLKISKAAAKLFNDEGRRLPDGSLFRADEAYIPTKLARGKDFMAVVKQTLVMEYQLNKERLLNNFLHVTLRVGAVSRAASLGRSGWHVDGHQGADCIQKDGTQLPIDRIYCISNTLPTQITDLRLDLDPIRTKARSKLMTLDQYNLEYIIQKTVEKAEADAHKKGKTIITTAGENCLFYANSYVIHQAAVNESDQPVQRSFLRLLYTMDEHDRIGDTVSPIIGPCYPFKIKTITDILQLPDDVEVAYHNDVTMYPL